jgi:hypothetical protein
VLFYERRKVLNGVEVSRGTGGRYSQHMSLFGSFVEAINVVRAGGTATHLRLTTTNAFAARWLVPRLPQWRKRTRG